MQWTVKIQKESTGSGNAEEATGSKFTCIHQGAAPLANIQDILHAVINDLSHLP